MEMPLDVFHLEMTWPQVPDDICDEVLNFLETSKCLERQIWQVHGGYAAFQMHLAPAVLIEWCNSNLPLNFSEFTIAVQKVEKDTHHIHRDNEIRDSSYNFVITAGGGITKWYDDQRQEIHEFEYAERVWYQHQGRVLHGVTNISPPRISITIFKNKWKDEDYDMYREKWLRHQERIAKLAC